ncbi:MAG: hypothetical protein LDL33_13135 [Desulfomonile sp.]|nr:hypothetical protein [Desulfomonile sp.]
MRYLTLFVVVLALWFLMGRFIPTHLDTENPGTIRGKLRDFAQYLHWVFGVVAVVLLGVMVVRLIVVSLRWQ